MANNQVQKVEEKQKSITDVVLGRVNALKDNKELITPPNYSPENALKSAYLKLLETKDKNKKNALEVCTTHSISNALLDMVIQGLSPAKNQCYFVVYGNQLQLMKSYLGTIAVAKRLNGIKDVKAHCIYEGDEFELGYDYKTGNISIEKFKPNFDKMDFAKMRGAFAVITGENGVIHTEAMNMTQIENAWTQRFSGKLTDTHIKFKDEMAKKTVINRACKRYVNTSDDSDLLVGAFNNTLEVNEEDIIESNDYQVEEEIQEKANKTTLSIEEPTPTAEYQYKEKSPSKAKEKEPVTMQVPVDEIIEQSTFAEDEECPF